MSLKAMSAVWEDSLSRSNDRLVLLAIADAASGDDGTGAILHQDTLARKAGLSVRTVQRSIAQLLQDDELRVDRESTRTGNSYTVVVAWKRLCFGAGKTALDRDRRQVGVSGVDEVKSRSNSGAKAAESTLESSTHDNLSSVTRHDCRESDERGEVATGDNLTRQSDGSQKGTHDRSDVSDTPSGGVPDPFLIPSLSRARETDDNLTCVRGGTLIGRGESVRWQQMDRHHAKCHPEICNWRDKKIPQCMPLALVDEFARKLPEMVQSDAVAYVITFAVNDRPPAGYVLPGTIYKHWADRWDAAHVTSRDQQPRPGSRVVPDASETDNLIREMGGGRFQL